MQLCEEMVGITAAKSELPRRVRSLESGAVERVVIVRQNNPVAVIVTVAEYDRMRTLEEMNEQLEDLISVLQAEREDDGIRISLEEIKQTYNIP